MSKEVSRREFLKLAGGSIGATLMQFPPTPVPESTFVPDIVLTEEEAAARFEVFQNMSQAEFAHIVQNAERMTYHNEEIDLNFFQKKETELQNTKIDLFGVVLDNPYIKEITVNDLDGSEVQYEVYVIPYLLKDTNGRYFPTEVIVGVPTNRAGIANWRRGAFSNLSFNGSSAGISEAMSLLEPGIQTHLGVYTIEDEQLHGSQAFYKNRRVGYPDDHPVNSYVNIMFSLRDETLSTFDKMQTGQSPIGETPTMGIAGIIGINT